MLCNFAVGVKNIEQIIDANGNSESKLHLVIICGNVECEISIDPDCTDNLIKAIQKQIPQAYINPMEKRGNQQLSAYISMILESGFRSRPTFKAAGWTNCLGDGLIHKYIHDGLPRDKDFKAQTGKTLYDITMLTPNESFFHAVRMLFLSKDIRKTLPLFLVSHLGILFSLFEDAGYPPRFVTFIYGPSGSLKTSVSKIFFKILKDQSNDITANFNDTATALEIKMGNTKDEVLLIDDYRPSALRTEAQRINGNFEKLVRFYGDGVGKGRGNVNLTLQNEFKPRSMCAMTGEFLFGTKSSLLRLLIIHISRNTFDKDLLKFYQDNPRIFTTHIKFFIDYLSIKYEEIVCYIKENYVKYRNEFRLTLTESRLIDTAVCLKLTAEIIINKYANECGLVYPKEISAQLGYWNEIIKQVVKESENLASHNEPYDMYLYAMVNSINSGELKICGNKELYSAYTDGVGFLDARNQFLYIRAQDAYNQVVRYWDKMGRYFSTTDKTVRKDLVIHNFLLTQSEERKENTTRVVRINN